MKIEDLEKATQFVDKVSVFVDKQQAEINAIKVLLNNYLKWLDVQIEILKNKGVK